MPRKLVLTVEQLQTAAGRFARSESKHHEPSLYGVTDGKAVGTYLEKKFRDTLKRKFDFREGNSADGIDFPELHVDLKVTSVRQPQSSCPFRDARQKIYGLGYALLVFVYEKSDDAQARHATLNIQNVVFVEKHRTGDFQTTRGLRELLANGANRDDLMGFLFDKNLPIDDVTVNRIADDLLRNTPEQGYLTISNALQWRLQYGRVVEQAGRVEGVVRVS